MTRILVPIVALALLFPGVGVALDLVTGNGSLVAGLSADGALCALHWPGPAAPQHLTEPGRWYILGPGGPAPLTGADWRVTQNWSAQNGLTVKTEFRHVDNIRSAVQLVATLPETDVLVIQISLRGFHPDTRLGWVQTVAPAPALSIGLAPIQGAISRLRETVTHFDAAARVLLHGPPEDARYPTDDPSPGARLGTVALGDLLHGGILSNPTEWRQGAAPQLASQGTGTLPAMLEIAPRLIESGSEFAVVMAAADTQAKLRERLDWCATQSADDLLQAADPLAAAWLATVPAPLTEAQIRPCLNLITLHDRNSGAQLGALHDPEVAPYSAVISSAWASAALDRLGLHEPAAMALDVHLRSVRLKSSFAEPAGSLPARIHATGRGATFKGNADAEAAAWLLAACLRHGIALGPEGAAEYAGQIWPRARLVVDFLAREPAIGAALAGRSSIEAPLEALRVHYLGLESGRRLAQLAGRAEGTRLADARAEVYARIRFRELNEPAPREQDSLVDAWLAFWPAADTPWNLTREVHPPNPESPLGLAEFPSAGPRVPLAIRDAMRILGVSE